MKHRITLLLLCAVVFTFATFALSRRAIAHGPQGPQPGIVVDQNYLLQPHLIF